MRQHAPRTAGFGQMDADDGALVRLRRKTLACRRCPELRRYCAEVARRRKREFADETYWGKPVPSLGGPDARLLIVGLAPAAHGGNRTGRMFTGDSSGAWLARAMHRYGFATTPRSLSRGDGFAPIDAFITAALRCAPPKNKPTPSQLANCAVHLRAELELLSRVRVVIALGKIGFNAAVRQLRECGYAHPGKTPRFAHEAEYRLDHPFARHIVLIGCYHPSRQNTNTGKLTGAMFDRPFARARAIVGKNT